MFFAFLIFLCISSHPLISAQHLQLVQSQAELEPAGAVTIAEWSSRQWPQSGLLGLFQGISSSRAASPAQNHRKGELEAVMAAITHGHYPRGRNTFSAIVPLVYPPAMGVDMGVSMTGGPLGAPALVPGPVFGRKGSWSLNHTWASGWPWHPCGGVGLSSLLKCPGSPTCAERAAAQLVPARMDVHGARVGPTEHIAFCMRKLTADGVKCGNMSGSCRGGPPENTVLTWPILSRTEAAGHGICWQSSGFCPGGWNEAVRVGPIAGQYWVVLLGLTDPSDRPDSTVPAGIGSIVTTALGQAQHPILSQKSFWKWWGGEGTLRSFPQYVCATYWEPKSVHSAEQLWSVTSLQLLAMSCLVQPWVPLSILCQGHLAGPCSPSCPPGPPGLFLSSCFTAVLPSWFWT